MPRRDCTYHSGYRLSQRDEALRSLAEPMPGMIIGLYVKQWEAACGDQASIYSMMTSSNGNIFRVTGPLIHRSPVNSRHKGQWRGALVFSLICVWINGSVNNGEAGDLRRHRAHYDVIVMLEMHYLLNAQKYPLLEAWRQGNLYFAAFALAHLLNIQS